MKKNALNLRVIQDCYFSPTQLPSHEAQDSFSELVSVICREKTHDGI